MGKINIAETILAAIAAIVAAAKAVVKFIGYIVKAKQKPAET